MKQLAIIWFLLISVSEVAIILALSHRLGAYLILGIFAAFTVLGLAIQWIRWRRRFKAMRYEAKRLGDIMRARTGNFRNWDRLPEYGKWSEMTEEIYSYWLAVVLLFLPGFLCHTIAALIVFPLTRPLGYRLVFPFAAISSRRVRILKGGSNRPSRIR